MTRLFPRGVARRVALFGPVGLLAATALIDISPADAQKPAPAGDAAKGRTVFAKCAICHSVEPGKNKIGPSLAGVVGRKPGTVPGYAYSAAMKANAKPWTAAQLDLYLTNPRATVPGTKMIFQGLPQPADRAHVIAYLGNPAAK